MVATMQITGCTRVFMIAHGRRVLYGNLGDIKRQYSSHSVVVRSNADYCLCPLVAGVRTSIGAHPTQVDLLDSASPDAFLAWLVARDAHVESFAQLSLSLEDIFVRVIERAGVAV